MSHVSVDWTKPLRCKRTGKPVVRIEPTGSERKPYRVWFHDGCTLYDVSGNCCPSNAAEDICPWVLENFEPPTPDIAPHAAELAEFHKLARHWGWAEERSDSTAVEHLRAIIDNRQTIIARDKDRLIELERTVAGMPPLPESRELLRLSAEAAKVPGLEAKVDRLRGAINLAIGRALYLPSADPIQALKDALVVESELAALSATEGEG